jgi:hypothetical protein
LETSITLRTSRRSNSANAPISKLRRTRQGYLSGTVPCMRVRALVAAILVTLLTGCSRAGAGAGAGKMAACIEGSGHGWRRVTHPFRIKGLERLDLQTSWNGGPQEEEDGSLEPYDDVYSLDPHVHLELAVLGKTPIGEANQTRLLRAVQADPSAFQLVLISHDSSQSRARGWGVVEECSERLYPHQGP